MSTITPQPSLQALAMALRHPESWPAGFTWNYQKLDNCALGLAGQLWPLGSFWSSENAATAFSMPRSATYSIFWNAHVGRRRFFGLIPLGRSGVTPAMVADKIDRYLATAA
jgi:hypothetical protein